MIFTEDELKILESTISHDIATLKRLPKKSEKFNNLVSRGIMAREKIESKIQTLRDRGNDANG